MRADMAKVIVERPRRGGGWSHKKGKQYVDSDLLVSKEGMRAPHVRHWGGKELNENLAPLRRFLHSRVGEPWDKVYSEISENLKVTSTVQQHVRDHVTDFVSVTCSIQDGEIYVHDYGVRPLNSSWSELYVDPEDGVLKKNPHYMSWNCVRRKQNAEHQEKLKATQRNVAGVELRKHKGIWYEVELKEVPPTLKTPYTRSDGTVSHIESGGSAYDVILECTVYYSGAGGRRYHVGPYQTTYCASKRQLNRNELKKYGVTND